MHKIIVFISLVLFSFPILATDGNALIVNIKNAIKYMESPSNYGSTSNFVDSVHLIGKVKGVLSTVKFSKAALNSSLFCPPDMIDVTQSLRVILKFAEDTPGMLHFSEDDLIIIALSKAWPCANNV
ncbi:Rap1a/Tai family immunity protein [Colwellia psychrerythraea]|uniref:Rap1a immunity protein domain-containing protein n=1 Tax=Colwellia psychrerythraea (strain 34H / ATCC BAA-681) TaxID=167879 RepID=Q48AE3_COLP3|nr:Rap1a/Tai family immunity protein [Colwellia psychrerythraea]AAZ24334.1 hypothetical protein CPS_0202 [Colwellia psychrerythraea 34H]